ncbi:MAG: hypothetical protein H0V44_07850 [Planctomycetes bacterium]|nr:hypothetical protein [Planctomycetota bacterium]
MRISFVILMLLIFCQSLVSGAVVTDPDCIRRCNQTWTPIVEAWVAEQNRLAAQIPAATAAVVAAEAAVTAEDANHSENLANLTEAFILAAALCAGVPACEAYVGSAYVLALAQEQRRYLRIVLPLRAAYDAAVVVKAALVAAVAAAEQKAIDAARSRFECKFACTTIER